MVSVQIVDPRADFVPQSLGAGPALPRSLDGARVGICTDDLWPSYDWVADEWATRFEQEGTKVARWRASEAARTDSNGGRVRADFLPLAEFLSDVDFAIVGLGNCGSCTNRTIDDTVAVLGAGVGAVAVVTSEFEMFAKVLAKRLRRGELRIMVLPYPLVTLPETELRSIAQEHFQALLSVARDSR